MVDYSRRASGCGIAAVLAVVVIVLTPVLLMLILDLDAWILCRIGETCYG